MEDLLLHNEGQKVSLVDTDGSRTGYAIQLERLTHQGTGTAVLKLGIIDEATDKTLAYSWTQPGSHLIGMNLRWIRSGLTALE